MKIEVQFLLWVFVSAILIAAFKADEEKELRKQKPDNRRQTSGSILIRGYCKNPSKYSKSDFFLTFLPYFSFSLKKRQKFHKRHLDPRSVGCLSTRTASQAIDWPIKAAH